MHLQRWLPRAQKPCICLPRAPRALWLQVRALCCVACRPPRVHIRRLLCSHLPMSTSLPMWRARCLLWATSAQQHREILRSLVCFVCRVIDSIFFRQPNKPASALNFLATKSTPYAAFCLLQVKQLHRSKHLKCLRAKRWLLPPKQLLTRAPRCLTGRRKTPRSKRSLSTLKTAAIQPTQTPCCASCMARLRVRLIILMLLPAWC